MKFPRFLDLIFSSLFTVNESHNFTIVIFIVRVAIATDE